MDVQQQIQNEVDRAEAGYIGFRRFYTVTTPLPEKEDYQSENRFIQIVLGVILTASMIVSGSHTIITFSNGSTLPHLLVGFAGFCMLELTLAAFAFVGTQRHYRVEQSEPKSFKRFILAGVVIPFIVMILGNIDDTFRSRGIEVGETLHVVILLGVALSGPLLAFIVGDVLAMYSVIDRVQRRRHDKAYQEVIKEWEEGLRRSWASKAGDYGGRVKVSVDRVPVAMLSNVLSEQTDTDRQQTDTRQSGAGFTRVSSATQQAKQWLSENPDKAGLPLRQLSEMIGVGKDSIAKALREISQNA